MIEADARTLFIYLESGIIDGSMYDLLMERARKKEIVLSWYTDDKNDYTPAENFNIPQLYQ